MKAEIISPKVNTKFTPITVQITCETIQEARALFHVTNHQRSAKLAHNDYKTPFDLSSDDHADGVGGRELCALLKRAIESQGFRI